MKKKILLKIKIFSLLSLLLISMSCNDDYSNLNVPFPAPGELKGTKVSAGAIKLSWKDNSRGEEGFVIEKVVIGSQEVVTSTVGANITEWEDNNVAAVSYKYSVYAFYKERKSDPVSIVYQHIPVNEPGNFNVEILEGKVELNWTAALGDIDGYTIERKLNTGSFTVITTVNKNILKATDANPVAGILTYRIYATQGEYKSVTSEKTITFTALPQITINSFTNSYLHLSPNFSLSSDGGEACAVGVCWSTSPNPTILNNKNNWHVKLNSGGKGFAPATHTNTTETIYMRAFATNSGGTAYSNEVSGSLQSEPAAINLIWTAMSSVNVGLPTEIRAYETSTQLNGRNFKAYYVIADMSTGNIELKTVMSSTARKPTAHIAAMTSETVYAMTNGGYFGYNSSVAVSYSMVIDRGQKLEDNIGALARGTNIYPVTRGVFGVTQNQSPTMKWAVGNFAYDVPSPNVEGETPQPSLTASFPATSTNWNAFTAIGGAPVLLKNGKMVFDFTTTTSGKYRTNYELLQTDIFSTSARPPRTVIGSTADDKIILFVCDGRQTHSDGATLTELAQVLKGIGCINALNLDGGGSSAIVVAGSVLNKPSDGTERAVPSVVGLVKKK